MDPNQNLDLDNPYDSTAFAADSAETARPSPRSIMVFGVLNLLFGLLLLLSGVVVMIMFAAAASGAGIPNPTSDAMDRSVIFAGWIRVSMLAGCLAAIALAISGIALLSKKEIGRRLAIYYAYYALVTAVIGVVMSSIYVLVPLLSEVDQQGPALFGAIIGAVFGTAISLLYPALLLYYMTRPAVIQALDPGTSPLQ